MEQQELIPHLFRTEYRKIVAVLCKRFGADQLQAAEDIASDTFLTASQTWTYNGLPENPVAWLYSVAKNKALNYLQRHQLYTGKIIPVITGFSDTTIETSIDLSPQNISDSQLQMMFAICHPAINAEAQIGLALRILCGFGIEEIADAFLTSKDTINKRLFRAKEKLRQEKISIEFPGPKEIDARLATVLTTLYLLFNEGYYSESNDNTLREELCLEAMRLASLLTEYAQTDLPPVNALLSLMCFHASRFAARKTNNTSLVLYEDQDETLWNRELITKGAWLLKKAATGRTVSKYHIEAAIAYWQTQKINNAEKWTHLLQLHDQLLQVQYSPLAALNRIYALSKLEGKQAAIKAAEQLPLSGNRSYHLLLGDLYTGVDNQKAAAYLTTARSMTKTKSDKVFIQHKLDKLGIT